MTVTARCKRKAEEDDRPLRQIFDEICRESTQSAAQQISFGELENSMYKRRRLAQPVLPSSVDAADISVRNSRYAQIRGEPFYRGSVETVTNGSALIFASTQQLDLLRSAQVMYFDATFKVVPHLYYQLFTVFVSHADAAFPAFYALMSRKTQPLYRAVFESMKNLVPACNPESAMADFEDAPVSAFHELFPNASISGCWFHYAQAVMKRVQKLGLKQEYTSSIAVREIVQCLFGLPLLPGCEIFAAVTDIQNCISYSMEKVQEVQQLVAYIKRQWIDRQSVGPDRLSVHGHRSRTNNVLESYHAAMRRRIKVTHPNLFTFLSHLSKATIDYMTEMARVDNGLRIGRPQKKWNMLNETRIKTCINKFNSGAYSRLQFLRAVSHSMGAHTDVLQVRSDSDDSMVEDSGEQVSLQSAAANSTTPSISAPVTVSATVTSASLDDNCEVCLLVPRAAVALVPCGHSRFCASCADAVTAIGNGCPICRCPINLVLRLFN